MLSSQCGTCGAYYTGNEAFCTRCGAPRSAAPNVAAPYQAQQNQGMYGVGNVSAQNSWLQRYYSPSNIVKRIIIGRLIGWGIALFILLACVGLCLFSGLLSALSQH